MDCLDVREEICPDGVRVLLARFSAPDLQVDYLLLVFPGSALLEGWPVLRTVGSALVQVSRVDSLALTIAEGGLELLSFTGDWGSEFEPQAQSLAEAVALQSRSGRSSKGNHPWFALSRTGGVLSGALVWSGNWIMRFEPQAKGGFAFSGGLSDWQFNKLLQPGQDMECVHMVIVLGQDLNQVSQQYAAVGRAFWNVSSPLSVKAPVEWNHWWPYEDTEINEDVFR